MSDKDPAERKDGFRKRRKRDKGWMKRAIKEGVIPDPDASPQEQERPITGHVIDVPTARISGKAEE